MLKLRELSGADETESCWKVEIDYEDEMEKCEEMKKKKSSR